MIVTIIKNPIPVANATFFSFLLFMINLVIPQLDEVSSEAMRRNMALTARKMLSSEKIKGSCNIHSFCIL